jgi:hypothetical protein
MAQVLRNFLYLDSQLVDEFLAQLEGGLYGEEEERDVRRSERGVRGDVAVGPVAAGGQRGSAGEEETARTRRQTPESRFARLYDSLDATGNLQWLEGLDDAIWNDLRRGEIIEVEGTVAVSSLIKLADLAEQMESLAPTIEAISDEPMMDADTLQAMRGISAFGGIFGARVPLVVRAAERRFKFIADLDRSNLRTDLGVLEGEATVFGKIQRKLRPSDKWTLLDSIPGLASLPPALRQQMQKDVKNEEELPDLVIRPPAAILTPVAIYR